MLVFGALTLRKKQTFRTLKVKPKKVIFNWETALDYLRLLKHIYKKFVLFWDKATPHTHPKVKEYIEANSRCIKVEYFPTAVPELNPVEECWRQTKGDDEVVANKTYETFEEFHKTASGFYKKKRFNLDLRHYLCH